MAAFKTRALCALLVACIALQSVQTASAVLVIRNGFRPWGHSTTIVCRNNRPFANINGVWVEAAWHNNGWWPINAFNDVRFLGNGARSCARITNWRGPGGSTTVVRPGHVVVHPGH